jgi:hypothetical protein
MTVSRPGGRRFDFRMYGSEPAGRAGRSDGGGRCAGVAGWRCAFHGPGDILLRGVDRRGRHRRHPSYGPGKGRELKRPGRGALILLDELRPMGMMIRGDQMVSRDGCRIRPSVMVRRQTRPQRAQKGDEESSGGRTDGSRESHVAG